MPLLRNPPLPSEVPPSGESDPPAGSPPCAFTVEPAKLSMLTYFVFPEASTSVAVSNIAKLRVPVPTSAA